MDDYNYMYSIILNLHVYCSTTCKDVKTLACIHVLTYTFIVYTCRCSSSIIILIHIHVLYTCIVYNIQVVHVQSNLLFWTQMFTQSTKHFFIEACMLDHWKIDTSVFRNMDRIYYLNKHLHAIFSFTKW